MGIFLKNGCWFVDFRHNGIRLRRKVGPSRKQADLALKKIQVEIAENKYFDIKKENKTLFPVMADEYIEKYSKPNKRSYKHDIYNLNAHLLPAFKNYKLDRITPRMIEDYKIERTANGISPSKVNRELALLKHIYTKAIEWGKATDNPVKRVKMFRENNQRVRFLEKEEIKKLMDSCENFLKPIIAIAFNTGMRQGEIINLRWADIDLIRGVILVRNPKNGQPRYIPMNSFVKYIFEKLNSVRDNLDNPYIFYYNGEKPLTRFGLIRGAFNRAVEKAGIKDFHFHDLRHTFASHLIMSGADIMTVKELLGHKTLLMTLRYSHLSPNFKKSAVELLGQKLDTFWTLSGNAVGTTESASKHKLPYNWAVLNNGRVAESADARDLKSRVPQRTWGFKSPLAQFFHLNFRFVPLE